MKKLTRAEVLLNGGRNVEIMGNLYTVYFNNTAYIALELELEKGLTEIAHEMIGFGHQNGSFTAMRMTTAISVLWRGLQYIHPDFDEELFGELFLEETELMILFNALLRTATPDDEIREEATRAGDAMKAIYAGIQEAAMKEFMKKAGKPQGKKPLSEDGKASSETH